MTTIFNLINGMVYPGDIKTKRLNDMVEKVRNDLIELSEKYKDAGGAWNDYMWIEMGVEDLESDAKALAENRDYFYDIVALLSNILDEFTFSFIIEDEKVNDCVDWCKHNLTGKYTYNQIEDKIIFTVMNDEDAAAFKLRWQ